MLVALQTPGLSSSEAFEVHNLPDPGTLELRPYLVGVSSSTTSPPLCEITAVEGGPASLVDDDYHSFAVSGQYIVQNGTLHVITPVDPLFWLLRDEHLPTAAAVAGGGGSSDTNNKSQSWQPIEQMMNQYDPIIRRCLQPQQLMHILAEMSMNDEMYVKFSADKAVQWLRSKQQAVHDILYRHLEEHFINQSKQASRNGAFLSGFTVAEAENELVCSQITEKPNGELASDSFSSSAQPQLQHQQEQLQKRAREESIQVVCNYLSLAWRVHFLNHLQVESTVLEASSDRQCPQNHPQAAAAVSSSLALPDDATTMDWNTAVVGGGDVTHSQKTSVVAQPITAGAKRLLKVNRKGLQKMSAFFGAKKSKTN